MTAFLLGFILGLLFWLGYKVFRCLRASGWDSSNVLNVLRADSFLAVHPEVYPYLCDTRRRSVQEFIKIHKHAPDYKELCRTHGKDEARKAFPYWYLPYDEFKEVVETVEDK